jgi:hypothetical protein
LDLPACLLQLVTARTKHRRPISHVGRIDETIDYHLWPCCRRQTISPTLQSTPLLYLLDFDPPSHRHRRRFCYPCAPKTRAQAVLYVSGSFPELYDTPSVSTAHPLCIGASIIPRHLDRQQSPVIPRTQTSWGSSLYMAVAGLPPQTVSRPHHFIASGFLPLLSSARPSDQQS